MKKVMWLVLLFSTYAAADTRYVIHPTNGEFVKTTNPCGKETKDELFNRVIKFVPTLVVRSVEGKVSMILNIAGDDHPAQETKGINEGLWIYDGKQSYKRQKVVLTPWGKVNNPNKKVITISVIRRLDELECSEQWVGEAEVDNGK